MLLRGNVASMQHTDRLTVAVLVNKTDELHDTTQTDPAAIVALFNHKSYLLLVFNS